MTKLANKFDLEERTAKFGESIIAFVRNIKLNPITKPLVSQLTRSATSIGANYQEANGACSRADFKNKIFICKKEAQETKHWLRMMATAIPGKKPEIKKLWREYQELTLIFSKITTALKGKNEN